MATTITPGDHGHCEQSPSELVPSGTVLPKITAPNAAKDSVDAPPRYSPVVDPNQESMPAPPSLPETSKRTKTVFLVTHHRPISDVDQTKHTCLMDNITLASGKEAFHLDSAMTYEQLRKKLHARIDEQFKIETGPARENDEFFIRIECHFALFEGDEVEGVRVMDSESWVGARGMMFEATGRVEMRVLFGFWDRKGEKEKVKHLNKDTDEQAGDSAEEKRLGKRGKKCVVQ